MPPWRWPSGLLAAGLAVAWFAGSPRAVRAARWPAIQSADWQFDPVASVGAIVLIALLVDLRRARSWLACFVFFAGFFALLLQRMLVGLWPGPGAWVWPLGLTALALVNAGALSRVGPSVQASWTFFALLVFSVLSSVLLTFSGAASLGHSAALLASACGAVWLVSWALRRPVDLGLAAFVSLSTRGGLFLQGLIFGGLPWPVTLLIGVVWPAAAASGLLHAPESRSLTGHDG